MVNLGAVSLGVLELIKCKGTFEKREFTTEPKFVYKRRATVLSESDLGNVKTFENENGVNLLRMFN